jgi:GNAT superfamily N-acetyltransferase
MVRTGLIAMLLKLGWAGFQRSMRPNQQIDQKRSELAPERHWHLMASGVAPSKQGRGISSALIQPVLEEADAERLPYYLETLGEKNLGFYAKPGFEVNGEGRIPQEGPSFWTMVRSQ